jgi:hydrogenase maturation factor
VEIGKVALKDIKGILERNADVMLSSNVIGSDFSYLQKGGAHLVLKIEPMVFYKHLSVEENAILSVIFPLNDFVTSGTWPTIAMIDFERPKGAGIEFYKFVDSVLDVLRERRIKVASGHTGNYGNLGYGVAGTMAFIGMKKPVFNFKRIRETDSFYSVGLLGDEMSFFRGRKMGDRSRSPNDLSLEPYVSKFLKMRRAVHFVHDLSEGGLERGLNEISHLVNSGFNVTSRDLRSVTPIEVKEYGNRIFSSSSSGSLVVSVDSGRRDEFEAEATGNSWPFFEIEKKGKGVTLDGRKFGKADTMLDFIS